MLMGFSVFVNFK